uniref:Uncharacterized protein n=1 Tax=Arundo donax TaxID=35708 RepID=A0A0A9DDQ1_ARUDO
MLKEIHLTSRQSYSISHGTQLRILSHVLLQIACICIMRRGCPTDFFFGLLSVKAQGLSTATRETVQDIVVSSSFGARRGR